MSWVLELFLVDVLDVGKRAMQSGRILLIQGFLYLLC